MEKTVDTVGTVGSARGNSRHTPTSPTSLHSLASPTGFSNMTGGKLIRPSPAEIEFKNMRFLITEQPHDSSIRNYITILKEHKVTHLVCATDPTYKTEDLAQSGVTFTELSFSDGSAPSQEIIERWLSLVKKEFEEGATETCVGVHCVTGLGRAPVLVAVALVELGMKYEDAVELIRKKRRGAINAKQLEFLAKYKRRKYFLKGKNKCQVQ
jgi:protein tyrosine phosphatase type 4A